ncbi:DUF6531 domain-containing protein [Streptomyces inhibens]|uniref:DUF6531 domain-containing protein n=1 Tax=Streptomyces inhibens TaxID=2293571 RepID=UPI00402B00A0
MGVVLPGWADEVLDIIGVSWPNVDEDDYREMATAMREFADDIDDGANEAHTAIQGLVGSAGGSLAIEALNAHWGKINGTHLKNLGECGRLAATALDGVAVLIEGAKLGAIVQLGILAAEVVAAQVAAPFTLGLSEVGALAATQATRVIVKRLFKEVCQQVAEQVISMALTPVEEALGAMVGDLVVQLGANALGVQDGVDLKQTANAGKEGFNQGVQGAKDAARSAAENPMELLSAGGGGGGGAAGGFSFDPDEHDRAVTGLQSAGGTFRNKAGGKIGRARSHHGRTRGKDAIADAANAMLDKVIDGIEDGVKKTAKHLDDNMTRGVKQMAKNHRDNDKSLSDHFTALGKGGKNDPKSPHTSLNSGGKGPGGSRPGKNDPSLAGPSKGGQPSNGNIGCHTAGDPVDVVSGQMITNERDLELPGLLPLVLRRAYASSYAGGRLFGPGWSSTLDQRVEIDTKGIHYAGDDAQILHYPLPTHTHDPGHRIELDEVESAMAAHSQVAQAVAAVREDRPGDSRLVGYVVPAAQDTAQATDPATSTDLDGTPDEADRVRQWRQLYDTLYGQPAPAASGADFTGWNSSYDGQPTRRARYDSGGPRPSRRSANYGPDAS